MIENEIQDFQELELSFNNNKAKALEMMKDENNEIDNEIRN